MSTYKSRFVRNKKAGSTQYVGAAFETRNETVFQMVLNADRLPEPDEEGKIRLSLFVNDKPGAKTAFNVALPPADRRAGAPGARSERPGRPQQKRGNPHVEPEIEETESSEEDGAYRF
jgi:hypothetical protein